MRIVDVCAFYTPHGGGIKTYIDQKLQIGSQLGHEIIVVSPADRYSVQAFGNGARHITLPAPRFPLDRKYWFFDDERKLHGTLDALQPDLVEVSSPWRSPVMVSRWHGNVPRALVMHSEPLSAYAYRWLDPVLPRPAIDRTFHRYWSHLRQMSRQFDSVICASEDVRKRLAAGGVVNTLTIPMGVDLGMFHPARRDPDLRRALLAQCGLDENATLLIAAGRFTAEKRWPLIIQAVAAAAQHHPVGLVIYGEGKNRARLEREIGGNPHIRLMGIERDRARFATRLASADALVHGCEAETFCMTAAEARASGVPVIVPDCGGAGDHAADGGGLRYRAGSAMSATQAIIRFTQMPDPMPAARRPLSPDEHFAHLFNHYAELRHGAMRAA